MDNITLTNDEKIYWEKIFNSEFIFETAGKKYLIQNLSLKQNVIKHAIVFAADGTVKTYRLK